MASSSMIIVEWVLSYLMLGFIAYEIVHKLFGMTQPFNAMVMIIMYGLVFLLLNRFIYTPSKGGIFSRLLGYHAIPLKIIASLSLLAVLILHVQKELSVLGLTISTAIIVWLTIISY
jgi:hypothetical protein